MKIQDAALRLVKSEKIESQNFNIKTTPQAFKILSDQLYSDKIGAVIRELSTNAYDSHVEANKKNVPFTVHLPTKYESWFSVYDEGIGLCESDIHSLYTTYFSSNKTQNNEVVGCLGLGSKSPFAYCDSFSIISRQNGKKAIYTCFINSDGVPNISKMGSEIVTDEPNGLEIKLPVLEKDFNEFIDKARLIYKWFSVIPKTNINLNIKFDEYFLKQETYAIAKSNNNNYYGYNYNNNSFLIMGNIAYPLYLTDFEKNNFSVIEKLLIQYGIYIFAPLGSVEPTPSREALSYTKLTIKTIKTILQNILDDLEKFVEDKISKAKNIWDARLIVSELWHPLFKALRGAYNSNYNFEIKYKDNIVENSIRYDLKLKEKLQKDELYKNFKITEKVELKRDSTLHKEKTQTINAHKDIPIFFNDLKIGNYSRIADFLKKNNLSNAYVLPNCKYAEMIAKEECMPYVKTSTLPKPDATSRVNQNFVYGAKIKDFYQLEIPNDKINTLKGVYVVYLKNKHYLNDQNCKDRENPKDIYDIKNLVNHFMINDKFYYIPKGMINKINNKKLIDLKSYILDFFDKNKETIYLYKKINYVNDNCYSILINVFSKDISKINLFKKGIKQKDSNFCKFLEIMETWIDIHKNSEKFRNFKKIFSSNYDPFTSEDNLKLIQEGKEEIKIIQEIQKIYPLLSFASSHIWKEDFMKDAIHYINLIDDYLIESEK